MIDNPQLARIIFLIGMIGFTAAAAWMDTRTRRIPNKLTLPFFVAGLVMQPLFFGLGGLLDGLAGFGAGFGMLFAMWMVGTAGGGDVKLIGALSVWLGFSLTLHVLFATLLFVVAGTLIVVVSTMMKNGLAGTRKTYLKDRDAASAGGETIADRQKRRVMAYALPVALATWCVLYLYYPVGN